MGATGSLSATAADPAAKAAAATSRGNMLLGATMLTSSVGALSTSYAQSQALKSAGKYKAALAEVNSKMAGLSEQETLEQGDVVASRENMATQQKVGAVRAAQGASGVSVTGGSAALVRGGMTEVGAIDEMTIRNNAAKQAFGYRVAAIQDTAEAHFARLSSSAEAEQTLLSGGIQALETPLSIYSNYERFSRYMLGASGITGAPFPNASE